MFIILNEEDCFPMSLCFNYRFRITVRCIMLSSNLDLGIQSIISLNLFFFFFIRIHRNKSSSFLDY